MGLIDLLKHRLNPRTIATEMDAGVVRLAGQGAAEAAQAIFTGQGFVPYGPTDRPVPVEPAQDYNSRLEQAAARIPRKAPDNARER